MEFILSAAILALGVFILYWLIKSLNNQIKRKIAKMKKDAYLRGVDDTMKDIDFGISDFLDRKYQDYKKK